MRIFVIDEKIFLHIYNISKSNYKLKSFAILFNKIAKKYFEITYYSLLFILYFTNNFEIKLLVIPFSVYFLLKILRVLIKRDRPFVRFPDLDLPTKNKYSLPSNHTGASFMLSYTFMYIYPPLGYLSFIISSFIAFFRVVEGVHFPLDVLSSFFISTICALSFYIF